VSDPELEARRRTGRRVLSIASGMGCIGLFLIPIVLLAIWQFLAPSDRVPRRYGDGGVRPDGGF
jgi:hypothetical protein